MIATVLLILLHGLDGHDIMVNPIQVTSMHAQLEGKPNEHVAEGAKCLINTTDGKFVSVIETCDKVRELLATPKGDRR